MGFDRFTCAESSIEREAFVDNLTGKEFEFTMDNVLYLLNMLHRNYVEFQKEDSELIKTLRNKVLELKKVNMILFEDKFRDEDWVNENERFITEFEDVIDKVNNVRYGISGGKIVAEALCVLLNDLNDKNILLEHNCIEYRKQLNLD